MSFLFTSQSLPDFYDYIQVGCNQFFINDNFYKYFQQAFQKQFKITSFETLVVTFGRNSFVLKLKFYNIHELHKIHEILGKTLI